MILVPKKFRETLEAIINSATGSNDTEIIAEGLTIIIDGEMFTLGFEDAGDLLNLFDNVLITRG